MTRRGWSTPDQLTWLVARTKSFLEAREKGELAEWHARVFQAWFDQFPEPAPTAEQVRAAKGDPEAAKAAAVEKRKKQLKEWYQNHNRGIGVSGGVSKVLPLCKNPHPLLRWQAYMRLHGKRVMPVINKEWEEKVANGEPSTQRLGFVSARATQLLELESEEVRAEVEKYRKQPDIDDESGGAEAKKVKAQQQAIDNIPRTLQKCLESLATLTGWTSSIIVGGPDPRSSTFKTFTYHVGKSKNAGSTFAHASEDWGKVEHAFEEFLPKCYADDCLESLHSRFTAIAEEGVAQSDGGKTSGSEGVAGGSADIGYEDDSSAHNGEGEGDDSAIEHEDARPSGTLAALDDDFEEGRRRQIAANLAELQRLGLGVQPAVKKRPQPRPKKRSVTQTSVEAPQRQLRSRLQEGQSMENQVTTEKHTPIGQSAIPEPTPVSMSETGQPPMSTPPPVSASEAGQPAVPTPSPVSTSSTGQLPVSMPPPVQTGDVGQPAVRAPPPVSASSTGQPPMSTPPPISASSVGQLAVSMPPPVPTGDVGQPAGPAPPPVSASEAGQPAVPTPSPVSTSSTGQLPVSMPPPVQTGDVGQPAVRAPPPVSASEAGRPAVPTPPPVLPIETGQPPVITSPVAASSVSMHNAPALTGPINSQPPQLIPVTSTSMPTSTVSAVAVVSSSTEVAAKSYPNAENASPPQWWQEAYEYLIKVSDKPEWIVLCERWLTHERALGYPDGDAPNRLPSKFRPDAVRYWLSRKRIYTKPPPIEDVKRFGVEWKTWWLKLQPEWRVATEGASLSQIIPVEEDVDWGKLRRGGCNAFFLVIISLGWWWSAHPVDSRERGEVEEVMRDVAWVLSAMHNLLGNKRSGEDISSPSTKRLRR